MNRHETIVDRIRGADPAPHLDDIDQAELALITSRLEERRAGMTTDVRTPRTKTSAEPRRRRALAFGLAAAVVLVVLGVGLVLQGESREPEVVSPEVSTTLPSATTSTTAATESPAPTPTTEQSIALPTMADQMIRLVGDNTGSQVSTALDEEGRLVAAYYDHEKEQLRIVRCVDPGCSEQPQVITLGDVSPVFTGDDLLDPGGVRMALQPGGAPFVVMSDPSLIGPAVFACNDPDCNVIVSGMLPTSTIVQIFDAGVAPDGLPRIIYDRHVAGTARLELAVCGNPLCTASTSQIVTLDEYEGSGELRLSIASDGRLFVGSSSGALICTDSACSTGITEVRFDGFGHTVVPTPDGYLVWYRRGSEFLDGPDAPTEEDVLESFDLLVAQCDADGCREPVRVDAPWRLLTAWPHDVRFAALNDGTLVAGYTYWSNEQCAAPVEYRVIDPSTGEVGTPLATYSLWGSAFDLTSDGERLVATMVVEEGAVHAVEIPRAGGSIESTPTLCANQ